MFNKTTRQSKARFVKKKVMETRIKRIQALKMGRENKYNKRGSYKEKSTQKTKTEDSENLECLLETILNKKCSEYESLLSIYCNECKITTAVIHTNKVQNSTVKDSNMNTNSVTIIGAVYNGVGCIPLTKSLQFLRIPTYSLDVFQKYEKEVDTSILEIIKQIRKNEKTQRLGY